MHFDRRTLLRLLPLGALAGTTSLRAQTPATRPVPILFVHGNGDHAALWQTVVWRFESNGYSRGNLFAFNFTDPLARDDDAVAQANRSSAGDNLRELAEFVTRVLRETGAPKLALVASSRGGNAIRNYLSQEGAAAKVSHAVLCGTPNHGVFAWDATPGNEFNGKGPFLSRLNALPDEITGGPAWLTLRSDGLDKYAQPDGRFVGKPGTPTGITFEGPELKGATNLSLGALDHRETAFHPRAFREMFKFIAGREPTRIAIVPEAAVMLSGLVTGLAGGVATNRPVPEARVQVFALLAETGERNGAALLDARSDATGAWGPVAAPPRTPLEFVLEVEGSPVTHIYRSAFPRSSSIVHLRPGRPLMPADKGAAALVLFSRPRGYFGLPRDIVLIDGQQPTDVKPGVPTDSVTTLRLTDGSERPIACDFNEERIVCRPWPARDNHLTIAELTT